MKGDREKTELVHNWLRFAKENLLYARSGIKEEFSPFHTVCFLSHGSAEKYLKAYLIWRGWKLKKTHDLKELLGYCVDYDSDFEVLQEPCSLLNEYFIESRYPGDRNYLGITPIDQSVY